MLTKLKNHIMNLIENGLKKLKQLIGIPNYYILTEPVDELFHGEMATSVFF